VDIPAEQISAEEGCDACDHIMEVQKADSTTWEAGSGRSPGEAELLGRYAAQHTIDPFPMSGDDWLDIQCDDDVSHPEHMRDLPQHADPATVLMSTVEEQVIHGM
jgi:hypothetical protein